MLHDDDANTAGAESSLELAARSAALFGVA